MISDKLKRAMGTLCAAVLLMVSVRALGAPPTPPLPGSNPGTTDLAKSGLKGPVLMIKEMKGPDAPPDLLVVYARTGAMVEQSTFSRGARDSRHFVLRDASGRMLRKADLAYGSNGEADVRNWSDLEYSYDTKGVESIVSGYDGMGALAGTRRTTHAQNGKGQRIRTTVVYKGSPVPGAPGTDQTALYEYDPKGRLIKEAWYVSPWTLAHRVAYAYDSGGRCVSMVKTSGDGSTITTEKWVYDGAGRVVSHVETGTAGETRSTYRYDAPGFLVGSDTYVNGSKSSSMSVDPKARVVYFTSYHKGYRNTSVVDGNGLTIRQAKRNDKGVLLRETSFGYETDGNGNWTKMTRTVVAGEEAVGAGTPETTHRLITYYPEPTADGAYFEASGRVSVDGTGAPGVSLALSKALATGEASVVTDAAGNWFAVGLLPGTVVTPFKAGWVFEPSSAEVTADKPLVSFKGRPFEGGAVRLAKPDPAPPKPDPIVPAPATPETKPDGVKNGMVKEPPSPVIEEPSPAPVEPAADKGMPVSMRLVPTLGYAFATGTGVFSGPMPGIQATAELGRFGVLARGEVVCDTQNDGRNNLGIVELGAGYALLPRSDARLSLNAGGGWNTAYKADTGDKVKGHAFIETSMRFGSGTDPAKSLEVSLGTRFNERSNTYFRVGTTGNKTLTLSFLAVGIALAVVTSKDQ